MKTVQILKLTWYDKQYTAVYKPQEPYNPFWLYRITISQDEDGRYARHKRIVGKFANVDSILFHMAMH